MARGGKRPGAGRKKGSPNKRKSTPKAAPPRKPPVAPSVPALLPPRPPVDWEAGADPNELCKRGRGIILALMAELEFVSSHSEEIEDDIYTETADDKSPLRRQAMIRAVSLPTRASTAKNLAAALRGLTESAPGKKETAQSVADRAAGSGGKFATRPAPKLIVDNDK